LHLMQLHQLAIDNHPQRGTPRSCFQLRDAGSGE
jgi:hypothetical protein